MGPVPNEFMIVGEGPGKEDDRAGRPYVGKLGDELRRYFNGYDLPALESVFRTNIYRYYGGKDYKYTADDLARDEPDLLRELQLVSPKFVVALGRNASRYFLGDIDMDGVWGLQFYVPQQTVERLGLSPDTIICPQIHPAAGMHNSEMSPLVVEGFRLMGLFFKGEGEPRQLWDDPVKEPIYGEVLSESELRRVLSNGNGGMGDDVLQLREPVILDVQTRQTSRVAIDTEGYTHAPWSLQFSRKAGTGYLIRARRRDLLSDFAESACRERATLVYHSALHEFGMFRALGVPQLLTLPFHDTMVMSYLLQIEPRGLKPSALRHCNMKMDEYLEIIGDRANELAREYLEWIWEVENYEWEQSCRVEFERLKTTPYQDKAGRWKPGRKITKVPELKKSQLHKAVARVINSPRPYALWDDQIEDVKVAAYKRMGEMPEASLDHVDQARAVAYGCRDADATLRLCDEYYKRIESLNLQSVYDLELSTYPFIDRMATIGLKPDLSIFSALSDKLEGVIIDLRQSLCMQTGREAFNANSGDQVADYLFEEVGLEPLKMTSGDKRRGSTNDKILEALEREHPEVPVIRDIRSYREYYKLKNTFVDRLPDYVDKYPYDNRIHATFRTTKVVTGRLSSADPNVLAQPEHGRFAPHFKRGWVAETGHVIWQGDQSQVELRGLAHLSGDRVLQAIFRGELRNKDGSLIDVHAQTAHKIFGGSMADYMHKCPQRLAAKAVNFGIPMGMTASGLSVELRKNGVEADEDTAGRWLEDTLDLYVGVRRYMAERVAEAESRGYIRCLSGRIRYIGGIRSRNERVRAEAERFAFSTPIQESATFVMKRSEAIVWNEVLPYFWQQGHWVEPILQVHDCIKIECEEGLQDELDAMMKWAMTEATADIFSVPLAVESEYGWNMAPIHVDKKVDPDWYNPQGMRSIE